MPKDPHDSTYVESGLDEGAQRHAPLNSLGTWALGLGIASVGCGLLTGIPAVILGVSARRMVQRGLAVNGGVALIGIILGSITTMLSLIVLIGYLLLLTGVVCASEYVC